MVLTILPAGRGDHLTALLRNHAAGLLLGSAVTALLLTSLGALVAALVPAAGDALLIAAAALAIVWLPNAILPARDAVPWPRSSWQVPEQWRYTMPLGHTMFAFGFLLGVGVVTNAVFPVVWVLVVLTVAAGQPFMALAAWLVFAATRWAMTARAARRWAQRAEIPDHVHEEREFAMARTLVLASLILVPLMIATTYA